MGGRGARSGAAFAAALVIVVGCCPSATSSAAGPPAAECGQATAHSEAARQTRAMWISTVGNGDWPSRPGLPAATQQAQFRRLLDVASRLNLNTVYVQVRPSADAFYASPYEPWSRYLTGKQGGDPGYDPLTFMVEEAHARGLELHAWFNPYRVSTASARGHLAPGNPARQHPDWVHRYGTTLWYDPGLPQVRDLITRVVLDVVRRYDVDGVHFDDYFYPYPVSGKDFPDAATFEKYGSGFQRVTDWRRHNVDMLVRDVSAQVHAAKPWVRFGISPFGVWRNRSADPDGSDTRALQSYGAIYADSRAWVRNAWVDYVAPQLYWPIGYRAADYRTLLDWWSRQVAGTPVQLVIGQAAYRVGHGGPWDDPDELSRHMRLDSASGQVRGEAFFSATDLRQNPLGFATGLLREHFTHPALVPQVPRAGGRPPAAPTRLRARSGRLTWNGADAAAYAIYRIPGNGPACLTPDPRDLVKVVGGDAHEAGDPTARPGQGYTYYVAALDRAHRQSPASKGVNMAAPGG
jgi:uncharacterized lipoprotein YddW (UPF0748 family)